MTTHKGSLFGATLLVAGVTIGGGMLALPVATGAAGFFPSSLLMLFGWAFMTLTALFLIEVNLWMEEGAHIITMASRVLGRWGKATAWLFYLFVAYASLAAYTAGCGELLRAAFIKIGVEKLIGTPITPALASSLFALIFGFIIYLGNIAVGRINALLMGGLVLSYLLLIGGGFSHIEWKYLLRGSWGNSLVAAPLLLTIFSFQSIVPSLTIYLKRDVNKIKCACILGTTIALVVYLIWQALVLGTVLVDGDYGLAKALALGKPATEFLCVALDTPWIGLSVDFFAFFTLVTSFLGIGLGLFDFLVDGLKIKPLGMRKVTLALLVILPPLFIVLNFERVFLLALDVSGGLGDTILNGLLPALMLWVGRYYQGRTSTHPVFGGRPLILLVIAYALFVLAIELMGKFGIAFRL